MKNWIEAARLRTLPLSLSGIILGGMLAKWKESFDGNIFVLSCLTTILFQVLSNFANDYGDGTKGTDNENRIGPVRAIQSGAISHKKMFKGIIITVILSFISAIILLFYAFIPKYWEAFFIFIGLGIGCILAAIFYTMGKKPYGYMGLGDIFVFVFFGWVSVIGSEFLYTKTFNWDSLLPASAVGLFSVAVLNLNNMRDIKSDKDAGKNTLALRLGFQNAKYYQLLLMNLPFILCLIFLLIHQEQFSISLDHLTTLKPFIFFILFLPTTWLRRKILYTTDPANLDLYMKPTALLALFFAVLFGMGLTL
ncbi:1,4-dihydroxy-2-naphthoate polyprenyltransferase [Apibacter sp. HY039]|uniref:1,4-dihydroxy-2-naphthoate polyprenyltransferase n=1 Tax=Apibacter sp. HY039 TaxID=2501476 RepID=UPI000FEB7E87|nr:1,4-dihydroxy-2-naphthoate polyprenyltransferase [Apibacter sp. HY039]